MNKDLCKEEELYKEESEEWSPLNTAALMKRLVIQNCYKKEEEFCMICLEQMYQRMCEYLPCTHVFHFTCLEQLIEKRIYTCPLCRYDFKNTLSLAGIQVITEVQPPVLGTVLGNFTFTLFTNMDVNDFLFELLLRNYEIDVGDEIDDLLIDDEDI